MVIGGACIGLGQGWGPKPSNFIEFCPDWKVYFIRESISGYLVVKTLPRYFYDVKKSLGKLHTGKKLYRGSNWPRNGKMGHIKLF